MTDLDYMEMAADAEARRVDELTALRKQDTELIRQMLDALDGAIAITMGKIDLRNAAIAAGRARLEGTPAGAGEPFGYFHQLLNHEGKGNGVWLGAAERKVVEQAHTPGETSEEIVALYTAPQPTQPRAGAVPLTCEWTHNGDDGFWETACGEAWRFDDGGPGENNMHFCHSCGNSLRIKGGQHGTE